jgi:hypothetical protein
LKGRSDREPPAAFCVFRVGTGGEIHATRLFSVKGIEEKELA